MNTEHNRAYGVTRGYFFFFFITLTLKSSAT